MRKCCATLVLISLAVFARAQSIRYYSDTLIRMHGGGAPGAQGYGGIIHDGINAYIQGSSTVNGTNNPFSTILKVDTSGNTIWTSSPVNYFAEGNIPVETFFYQFIFGIDRNLYAILYNNTNIYKLAKIRESNGSVDWIVNLPFNPGSGLYYIHDYDNNSVVLSQRTATPDTIKLSRYDKATGKSLGVVSIFCPSPVFSSFNQVYIHSSGNIYAVSIDSCYKFNSFTNPTLAWKNRMFPSPVNFERVGKIIVEANNLLVFGQEGTPIGSDNGLLSCMNANTGFVKWVHHNSGPQEMNYGDHKIKNGFLYTTWHHASIGSTTNRCYINKIDTSNGNTTWEFNHPFGAPGFITPAPETMMSIEIDNNETIYLTGYGLPQGYPNSAWGFMKIRGSDGTVLLRTYIPGSDLAISQQEGYRLRLFGNKLYLNGKMTWKEATGRMDTATMTHENIKIDSAAIQRVSTVVGMANFSVNKKIIVKRIGKSLTVEMQGPFQNKLWEKPLGDTLKRYEGFDRISVNDFTKRIFITYRRYVHTNYNNYFFDYNTAPDSTFLHLYDSTGVLTNTYRYQEIVPSPPYQFFRDSINRTWMSIRYDSALSSNTYPGLFGSIGGKHHNWQYPLIKPETYFPLKLDTVLFFIEPGSQYSARPALMKAWPPYNFFAKRLWEWPSFHIKWFNTVERQGLDNFYVFAKDSSDRDLIFRYRYSDSTVVWSKTHQSDTITIKGFAHNDGLYTVSAGSYKVFLRRYNATNGSISWTVPVNLSANQVFNVVDFALSRQRNKLTIAGYIVDTMIKDMSKASVLTYDTAGNLINNFSTPNYKAWKNKGISVLIGQDGQTLVSGQTTDSVYGYAGFIYEVDTTSLISAPLPQIINITTPVCSSPTFKTGKLSNPMPPPFVVSVVMDNTVTLPYNPADSSFQYSIAAAGNHTIRVTYSFNTYSIFKDSSFVVVATPAAGALPSQNGNILTAPASGSSYQWYLNGNPISGATNNTYTITQNGIYSYTYTVNNCTSPVSPGLNALLTAIVDPSTGNIIVIYPTPAKNSLFISNLNAGSVYGFKISDESGRVVQNYFTFHGTTTKEIDLSRLQGGLYILELWNARKNTLIGNKKIVVVK